MDSTLPLKLERGSVVLVNLGPVAGHEQRGVRPCVIVSDPLVAQSQRYPLIAVVPLTTTPGAELLRPRLSPGASGLTRESYALVDQLRSIDKRRIVRAYGVVTDTELDAVDRGVILYLGLSRRDSKTGP